MNKAIPRKGARSRAEVLPEVLTRLNRGEEESLTLSELLVVDFAQLLAHCFPQVGREALRQMQAAAGEGITQRMALAAALLKEVTYDTLAQHPSDVVRGWAAYQLGQAPVALAVKLEQVLPLADDPNPGVREWAWIALRPALMAELDAGLALLKPWVYRPERNLRRFAVEITRPRGVWCAHIPQLKAQPELGLPLLEPLKAEAEKYPQDSVANWLNDASKHQPKWVQTLCARWQAQSPSPATTRIVKKALRSLE